MGNAATKGKHTPIDAMHHGVNGCYEWCVGQHEEGERCSALIGKKCCAHDIAAAPDLLEACAAMFQSFEDESDAIGHHKSYDLAKAALAKAGRA